MGTICLGHAEAVWSCTHVPFTANSVAMKLWSLPGELSLVEETDCNEAIISHVSQVVMEKHRELWGVAHRSQGGLSVRGGYCPDEADVSSSSICRPMATSHCKDIPR